MILIGLGSVIVYGTCAYKFVEYLKGNKKLGALGYALGCIVSLVVLTILSPLAAGIPYVLSLFSFTAYKAKVDLENSEFAADHTTLHTVLEFLSAPITYTHKVASIVVNGVSKGVSKIKSLFDKKDGVIV